MLSLAFHWILNWLLGWGGLSLLVAIGAGVVWWFLPPMFVKARSLALHVGIGALAYNAAYSMGYQNGATTVRTEWQAAEQRAINSGTDARSKAEAEIPPVADEPVAVCPDPITVPGTGTSVHPAPRAKPRRLSNDRYERDDR